MKTYGDAENRNKSAKSFYVLICFQILKLILVSLDENDENKICG